MLLTLLSSLDAELQRDAKVSLFGYLVMAGLSESPDRTLPMSDLALLTSHVLDRGELTALGEISRRILVSMTDGPIPGLRRRATP